MTTVARYLWGRTKNGYGWNLWQGCGLTIAREGTLGQWGVYEADGSRLCLCTDYRSAQRVVARVRCVELRRFNSNSYDDFAVLTQSDVGVTYHGYQPLPLPFSNDGTTFPTRGDAEALILSQELRPSR